MSVSKVRYSNSVLEPAPFIGINRTINRGPDGSVISAPFGIRVVGDLLAWRGSPNSSGNFYGGSGHAPSETISAGDRLASISTKIQALYDLFDEDYQTFSWTNANNNKTVTCKPRILSIETPEDLWFNTVSYVVNMEADAIDGMPELNDLPNSLEQYSDSWDFAPNNDNYTYSVRHSVSAVGRPGDGITPFDEAFTYVQSRLGYDAAKVGVSSSGNIDFGDFTPFNHVREEVRDEPGASYSVTESWVLSPENYVENYTSSLQINVDSDTTKSVSIQGDIQGFYQGLNEYSGMYPNALAGWNTIKGELLTRAESLASGIKFLNGNVSHDERNGNISYSYTYDNRPTSGVIDDYTVSRRFSIDNYITTVTIDGSIQGLIETEDEEYTVKYTKAAAHWALVYPDLYSRATTYASDVPNLKSTPFSRSVSDNPYQGNISYTFEYNDREYDTYEEDFQISSQYSRDDGITTVNVQGSVRGLSASGEPFARYMNASGAQPSDAEVFARAQNYYHGTIYNTIISKEITHQPYAGLISYNYVYNDETPPIFPNALVEIITVSDTNSSNIAPVIPIVGFQEVLQDIGSTTRPRRQIGIELLFAPSTGNDYVSLYGEKPDTTSIVDALKPSGAQQIGDVENWVLKQRRYTRTTDFIY